MTPKKAPMGKGYGPRLTREEAESLEFLQRAVELPCTVWGRPEGYEPRGGRYPTGDGRELLKRLAAKGLVPPSALEEARKKGYLS